MSSIVSDFYKDQDDFEIVLDSASMSAKNSREVEFVESISEKYEGYGMDMFMSDLQHKWLEDLAAR